VLVFSSISIGEAGLDQSLGTDDDMGGVSFQSDSKANRADARPRVPIEV
jgi:hypothetical protein